MALPLADIINKPTALIFSVTGCLFLSLLFISWGSRFYSLNTEDYLVKKQFKTYHSISDTIALSYPGKSLFLIGFPESLKNYYRSHRLVYGSNWTDKLIYDKHPQTAPNHITNFGCSFMNTDKPPVYLKWNDINETFTAVKHSGAENLSLSSQDLVQSISVSPDSIPVINSSEPGRIELFEPFISRGENKIEVTSGISPFAIWFHSPSLNPVKCNTLEITATFRSSEANKKDNGKIHLIFEAPESKSPQKTLLKPSDKNKYSLWNSPEWIGSSSIERFGIEFEPGIYNFELSGITFLDTQPGRSAQKKEEKPYGL